MTCPWSTQMWADDPLCTRGARNQSKAQSGSAVLCPFHSQGRIRLHAWGEAVLGRLVQVPSKVPSRDNILEGRRSAQPGRDSPSPGQALAPCKMTASSFLGQPWLLLFLPQPGPGSSRTLTWSEWCWARLRFPE